MLRTDNLENMPRREGNSPKQHHGESGKFVSMQYSNKEYFSV